MPAAPLPEDEDLRLAALQALHVLDTAPEPQFQSLVRAASEVCGTPISLISLVDRDRQWFKANHGLEPATQTPREQAFCAHAILGDELLEVTDATVDDRFSDNPLVTDDPHIRFYAGVPLVLSGGERVGTLCVIDRQPRVLNAVQQRVLAELARVAVSLLESRDALERTQALARERTLAQVQAQRQQERLAAMIDGTNAGTWEWNVHTGEVRFNERWAQIIGYTLDELQPVSIETWLKFAHPDDLASSQAALKTHFEGLTDRYECEARMLHRDGREVWVLDRGRVRTWTDNGKPEWMYGTRIDISAAKARERALAQSQSFLDRTGRTAGVGGWEVDLERGSVYWSDETCRIHGLQPGYQPDMETAINFYAPEARPLIEAAVQQAIASGKPWDLELALIRADDRRIWVRAVGEAEFERGRAVRLVGSFQDITLRKQAQLDLERSHELLSVTLESIGDGVITTDATGAVTWLNPVATTLTGYSVAEAVGLPVEDVFHVVHEQTCHMIPNPARRALEHRAVVALADGAVLTSLNGLEYSVEDSAAPILTSDGELIGAVLVFHDVTKQRMAMRALREREVAEKASAAKTEFLSRMSHELRTPLNAILGFTNLLMSEPHAAAMRRDEWLGHVQAAGNHLLGLVDEVLDIAKIEAGAMPLHMGPVNALESIEEVTQLLQPQAQARGVIVRSHSQFPDGALLRADARRFRQILFNLISNAIKYNRDNGRVDVEIRAAEQRCEIAVTDTGLGMTAQQLSRLFQPFERMGREEEGNGLGLVITRLLVSMMGGAIEVSSRPQIGTTFTIRLPLELGQTIDQAAALTVPDLAPTRSADVSLSNRRVLYIEDNAINRLLVEAYVKTMPGAPVLNILPNGVEGIAAARDLRPDLILVDLHLPDLHGIDVLKAIRAIEPALETPVVVLSASAMPDDRKAALDAGFSEYWTKPLDREAFTHGLRRLLSPNA